tara:strand:- start:5214 stop:5342 length:129 start_codon:yes stop_codon:yes gene_type:complete
VHHDHAAVAIFWSYLLAVFASSGWQTHDTVVNMEFTMWGEGI